MNDSSSASEPEGGQLNLVVDDEPSVRATGYMVKPFSRRALLAELDARLS